LKVHELKKLLQQHFSDGLAIVVGSGLSCAEGLPSMSALAAHLQAEVPSKISGADKKLWAEIASAIADNGLEPALLQHPPTPTLESIIVELTASFILAEERAVLAEVFTGKRVLRFTRLLKHLPKSNNGIPVITTNYDRLLEAATEEAGLGVDTMFVGQFAGRLDERESLFSFCRDITMVNRRVRYIFQNRVNICKPHGSLDWYFREGSPVRYNGDVPAPRMIITPGLNKFRSGYASPFDVHRERANRAIDSASRFLVIGYGFNDDHLETHLGPRIREGKPTLLLVHSLSENAAKLVNECSSVVALEHTSVAGRDSTRVFVAGKTVEVPDVAWWDLDKFISEVLEP
jgi:hypothetical protein